jgi:CAAX protease family protein
MAAIGSGQDVRACSTGEPVVAVRVYGIFGSILLTALCVLAGYAGAFVMGTIASITWSSLIAPVLMNDLDIGGVLMQDGVEAALAPYTAGRGFVDAVGDISMAIAGILALHMVVSVRALHARDYLGPFRISLRNVVLYAPFMAAIFVLPLHFLWVFLEESSSLPSSLEPYRDAYRFASLVLLAGIGVVVLGPLYEELLFRGFLYRGLAKSRLGVTGAIFVTSLLWAVLHYDRHWVGVALVFAMGIVYGWVRHRTDSVALPIAIHMYFNFFVFAPAAFVAYHGG